jgi:hypothetical protein
VGRGKKTGRKNRFLVIGNIKIIHAARRRERLEGMNVQTLKKLLLHNTGGMWDDALLHGEVGEGKNAQALGGKGN